MHDLGWLGTFRPYSKVSLEVTFQQGSLATAFWRRYVETVCSRSAGKVYPQANSQLILL